MRERENLNGKKTKKGSVTKVRPKEEVIPRPKKKCSEMEEFLTNMGMEKYIQTFTNNGFSDIATIINLCDDDFKVMRIPLGHKLKILKRIKDFKNFVSMLCDHEIVMSGNTSAINYFYALTSSELPITLIQAQRDYFGSHLFEKKDSDRGIFYHNNWE